MTNPIRIGDAERDAAVAALGDHFAAGRLSAAELDERTSAALRARVDEDLRALVADLPEHGTPEWPLVPSQSGRPAALAVPPASSESQRAMAAWRMRCVTPWLLCSVLFLVIWVATGAAYFWPVWPILGWGVGVLGGWHTARTDPATFLEQNGRGAGGHLSLPS